MLLIQQSTHHRAVYLKQPSHFCSCFLVRGDELNGSLLLFVRQIGLTPDIS